MSAAAVAASLVTASAQGTLEDYNRAYSLVKRFASSNVYY